jgi:pyridinium-3,5-bisthiocarboxylic acid mononucleotide nickel chelatase
MSRILYFDCFSGVSGDMVLGALIDAGVPIEALREALGTLGLGQYQIETSRVLRAGVAATRFHLREEAPERVASAAERAAQVHGRHEHGHDHHGPSHGHDHAAEHGHGPSHVNPQTRHHAPPHAHDHGHAHEPQRRDHAHQQHGHAHRSLADIEGLIERSALSTTARGRARILFRRLAEAEAAIHDVPIEQVHLHEVGALDSIIDIVGASFAIEWMRADRIVSSPINLGSGMVDCAHGRFPVPAPATARLVAGVPVYSSGPAVELTTPTGALLVTGYASSYGPLPEMTIERIGYGAGARELAGSPNVLRVIVGEATEARTTKGSVPERVTLLEFETDDMNPQLFGPLMESLQAAGALDVFYTAVQMKKNRPGTLVTVVAPPERRAALGEIVFRETTTLGVRYHDVLRDCLAREERRVETPFGPVSVKIARLGDRVVNAAPEFEDCLQLARQHGAPVKDVQAAALKAWLDAQNDDSTTDE